MTTPPPLPSPSIGNEDGRVLRDCIKRMWRVLHWRDMQLRFWRRDWANIIMSEADIPHLGREVHALPCLRSTGRGSIPWPGDRVHKKRNQGGHPYDQGTVCIKEEIKEAIHMRPAPNTRDGISGQSQFASWWGDKDPLYYYYYYYYYFFFFFFSFNTSCSH